MSGPGFRDQTWCDSDCANSACFRCFTPEWREKAIAWWEGEDFPIARANFRQGCPIYLPPPPIPEPSPETIAVWEEAELPKPYVHKPKGKKR